MIKFMYLAKRLPSLTPEGFTQRWRQHGALAMSLPFWKNMLRYVQADPIRPAPIDGTSLAYDAVAMTTARDDSLFTAPSPEDMENVQALLKDEAETFGAPIPPVMLMVEEDVFWKVGPGGVTAFLFFNDLNAARSVAQGLTMQDEKADRIVVNRVRADKPMSEAPLLHYKAIVEASAATVDKLKAVLDTNAAWRKADLAVVARETILCDETP